MSGKNADSMFPYAEDAERMLCEKFNFTPKKAKALVHKVLTSYMLKPHYEIQNPKRVLFRLVRKWGVKGSPRRPW